MPLGIVITPMELEVRTNAIATPIFISPKDAAVRTGFSVFTIRELIARGELPAYRLSDKPGSAIRVKISDVDALMRPVIPVVIAAAR